MTLLHLTPSQILKAPEPGSNTRVAGRVFQLLRSDAGLTLKLHDASASVSVFSRPAQVSHAANHARPGALKNGDHAIFVGNLVRDITGQFCLEHAQLEQHWPAPFPAENSEFQRTAFGERGPNITRRTQLLREIRMWFERAGFLEVDTPTRVLSPGSDAYVSAFSSEERYLITSPEHHMKRLVAAGFYQIFQLAHCFRRDESGHLHQPEFLMLEWYRAFASQLEVMEDTEAIVVSMIAALRPEKDPSQLKVGALQLDLRRPFERITLREAFAEYAGIADAVELAATDEDHYFQLFVDKVEPQLARHPRPVFLCEFPSTQAALARRKPSDQSVAERFELYLAGVELCNGYSELTDPDEFLQRESEENARKLATGAASYPADPDLLRALQAGFPPTGGNALGVDRLLALALGRQDIRGIVTFPHESDH